MGDEIQQLDRYRNILKTEVEQIVNIVNSILKRHNINTKISIEVLDNLQSTLGNYL